MPNGFSKGNQTAVAAFLFDDFALFPRERLLTRAGHPVPLAPKAFDALLCLVSHAQRLVTKADLSALLWPSVHVGEANLTNLIVSLRKAVGREAIRTVSKHGYRFDRPVHGEPGVPPATYERFLRARALTEERSLGSMLQARDLFWICLAEEPAFAPAWAWLGRCCGFLGKFSEHAPAHGAHFDMAQAAIRRALTLDPDLAAAHQFLTLVEVDTGHAADAMTRLLDRLRRHPGEPETHASLVQVLRYRGLLSASLAAHRRAVELDPRVLTGVAHTLFLSGEYASAIESYSGRAAFYLDAAAWAALDLPSQAVPLLRDRLGRLPLSPLLSALMSSLLALLEGNTEDAVRRMQSADTRHDPEILLYFARHYARLNLPDAALGAVQQAMDLGFVCAPDTLLRDPWFATLRDHPGFAALLHTATSRTQEAQAGLLAPS